MPRVIITVPERTPQPYRFQMDRTVVTLGRGSENDIAIDSGSVSVTHAEMHRVEGGYELRDVGSTNGIKLDGNRQEVIPLVNGSSASIGDVVFDFTLAPEEEEILAGERRAALPSLSGTDAASIPSSGPKPPVPARTVVTSSGGSGVGATLAFLILAAIAFFAGLFIRHQKDTGRSLIQDIQSKPAAHAPATPGNAAGEPAATEPAR